MLKTVGRAIVIGVLGAMCAGMAESAADLLVTTSEPGRRGGRLVVPLRAEPRTLNPVLAYDYPSREVIQLVSAPLVRINRETQLTEPALARSWQVSPDGRRFVLALRHGIAFSDGHPFTADDVVFTFELYLDEKVGSPHRDLLVVGGRSIAIRKIDAYTIEVSLAAPYAAAERMFDGIPILPRHLLEPAYRAGKFAQAWPISADPASMAGLGPFRVKSHVPGSRVVLERNPRYWKVDRKGQSLPYLDEFVYTFVPSEEAQLARLQAGEADALSRFSGENMPLLQRAGLTTVDVGPSLEYSFLFFNLNDLDGAARTEFAEHQQWFRDLAFRRAVSAAIDRDAIVRLAYGGRGAALAGHVTPGNRRWVNGAIRAPRQSVGRAKQLLEDAGFTNGPDGGLRDRAGRPVRFTLLTTAGNATRTKIAAIVQEDLGKVGIAVQVVPMEFRAMLDRITRTKEYDAALLALGGGDADPNSEMNVWLSSGGSHLWRLGASAPAGPWEAEIDRLMRSQLVTMDYHERKRQYDRVQELVATNLPAICLASPDVLVATRSNLGNVRPAVMEPSLLWNVDELFWKPPVRGTR